MSKNQTEPQIIHKDKELWAEIEYLWLKKIIHSGLNYLVSKNQTEEQIIHKDKDQAIEFFSTAVLNSFTLEMRKFWGEVSWNLTRFWSLRIKKGWYRVYVVPTLSPSSSMLSYAIFCTHVAPVVLDVIPVIAYVIPVLSWCHSCHARCHPSHTRCHPCHPCHHNKATFTFFGIRIVTHAAWASTITSSSINVYTCVYVCVWWYSWPNSSTKWWVYQNTIIYSG